MIAGDHDDGADDGSTSLGSGSCDTDCMQMVDINASESWRNIKCGMREEIGLMTDPYP